MNAPATISTIQRLSAQILSGDYSGLPKVDYQHYAQGEWNTAAQYVMDSGDESEFAFMLAREIAYDDFARHGERVDYAWGGFGNWFNAHEAIYARAAESYVPAMGIAA